MSSCSASFVSMLCFRKNVITAITSNRSNYVTKNLSHPMWHNYSNLVIELYNKERSQNC